LGAAGTATALPRLTTTTALERRSEPFEANRENPMKWQQVISTALISAMVVAATGCMFDDESELGSSSIVGIEEPVPEVPGEDECPNWPFPDIHDESTWVLFDVFFSNPDPDADYAFPDVHGDCQDDIQAILARAITWLDDGTLATGLPDVTDSEFYSIIGYSPVVEEAAAVGGFDSLPEGEECAVGDAPPGPMVGGPAYWGLIKWGVKLLKWTFDGVKLGSKIVKIIRKTGKVRKGLVFLKRVWGRMTLKQKVLLLGVLAAELDDAYAAAKWGLGKINNALTSPKPLTAEERQELQELATDLKDELKKMKEVKNELWETIKKLKNDGQLDDELTDAERKELADLMKRLSNDDKDYDK
jgi:hypothetical protein